jgi:hypothetical protein
MIQYGKQQNVNVLLDRRIGLVLTNALRYE